MPTQSGFLIQVPLKTGTFTGDTVRLSINAVRLDVAVTAADTPGAFGTALAAALNALAPVVTGVPAKFSSSGGYLLVKAETFGSPGIYLNKMTPTGAGADLMASAAIITPIEAVNALGASTASPAASSGFSISTRDIMVGAVGLGVGMLIAK